MFDQVNDVCLYNNKKYNNLLKKVNNVLLLLLLMLRRFFLSVVRQAGTDDKTLYTAADRGLSTVCETEACSSMNDFNNTCSITSLGSLAII